MATTNSSGNNTQCCLFYVWDCRNKLKFLAETGAAISVVPYQNDHTTKPTPFKLWAANGSAIDTYGERTLTLNTGMRRDFTWIFTVANVKIPILSVDFLVHYALAANMNPIQHNYESLCLRYTYTLKLHRNQCHNMPWSCVLPLQANASGDHQSQQNVRTRGPPAHSHPRRLAQHKLAYAKEQFDKMLSDSIIRPSDSPCASPLHLIPKPGNKEYQICINYWKWSALTISDRYPVPSIHDFASVLKSARIFLKIDLTKAYHQIPVAAEDIPKTVVTTPFGLYEFLKMPFGLCNAVQTFQRLIDEVLCGLLHVYINDILVGSKDADSLR